MVEIELSVLVRQCLGKRRLPDIETLRREVSTLGKRSATGWGWVSPGASPQPMRARSCVSSTHPLSLDGGLVIRGGSRERRHIMKKLMVLVPMLAMVLMLAAPAMAQDDKAAKQAQRAAKAEAKAAKAAQKGDKMKELPKSGGDPINASLLGLGAGAMLVGGGLLVRKVTR
jgi:hypothetical protein